MRPEIRVGDRVCVQRELGAGTVIEVDLDTSSYDGGTSTLHTSVLVQWDGPAAAPSWYGESLLTRLPDVR